MSGPFNDTIPNGTDPMQLSCPQLRTNFTQIFNAFGENHVQLTDLGDPTTGMHTQLELVRQGSDPATGSDEVALYSKTGVGGAPQVFFRPSSSGTPIQMSSFGVVSTGPNYQSFFAGPYIILFGLLTNVANATPVLFATYYPAVTFSEIEFVSVQKTGSKANPRASTNYASATNISITGFTIGNIINTNTADTTDIYYFVVGKP